MPMSPRLLRPRASGVHPEANAWRTAVIANGGTVSGSTMAAVSKFCRDIDAAGLRDRFYRLNLFCGTGLSAALVPLYRGQSPSGTQYGNTTDTNNNFVSGDYAETGSSGGLLGDGTTKILRTGVADATALGMAASAHVSAYVMQHSTLSVRQDVGNVNTDASTHRCALISGGIGDYQFLNSSGSTPAVVSSGSRTAGMYVGTGNGTTASIYRNGTAVITGVAVTQRTAFSWQFNVFGSANSAGTPSGLSNARLSSYSFGPGMTAAQIGFFHSAMQAFQTALGRNV
jgi:hypothetical protein